MAKFEIDLDDKGEFVGTLPNEVVAVIEKIKATAHGEGYGKGNQKAAEEARAQIASTVAAEKAKWEASLPAERAKWAEIEDLNKHLKSQLDATTQQSRKNLTEREEVHAAEITRRVERENKRNEKIRELVNQNLRALAARAGAREESLEELEVILRSRIGFSEDMDPFVMGDDGQPAKTTAGNALAMDVFVKQYLESHPHHRKPAAGTPGNARGGASFHGGGTLPTVEAARARIDGGDRSPGAINELFEAGRKRAS